MISKVFNFFKSHKIITLLFLLTLVLWLWQRSTGFSWDFATYSLNAEAMFGSGQYSELLRPPLSSAIMFPAGLNRALGEYFYIIFVSVLFLYSIIKLADSLNLNRTAFYVFSLTPFTIGFAFFAGAELTSLSLLYLSVCFIYTKKSGIFLSLLSLTRYTNFVYLPILLFQKSPKKIILSLILFTLILTPWLLYNWSITGDPLTSMSDFYALTIKYRDYIPFSLPKAEDFLFSLNFLLPFFLLGLIVKVRKKIDKTDILMLVVLAITMAAYIKTPLKDVRYLYHLTLPAAYFATIGIQKIKFRYTVHIFLVITLITTAFLVPTMSLIDPNGYKEIVSKVNCSTKSNIWVPLSYYGLPSVPSPREVQIFRDIDEGYRIIIQKGIEGDITNKTLLEKLPIIENAPNHLIIGDKTKCKPVGKADYRYLKGLNEFLNSTYNYTVPTNSFQVFFGKS